MTLYEELVAAGCEIDNHESDLYVAVGKASRPIIERYCWVDKTHSCTLFTGNDGRQWWDVPFAFDPFWRRDAVSAYRKACALVTSYKAAFPELAPECLLQELLARGPQWFQQWYGRRNKGERRVWLQDAGLIA
jgi:hypothetical protein